MRGLDERQKAFEAEFQRNQELAFRVTARRNRLCGLWAAERLGRAGRRCGGGLRQGGRRRGFHPARR